MRMQFAYAFFSAVEQTIKTMYFLRKKQAP